MKKYFTRKLVSLLTIIGTLSIGGCWLWWLYMPEVPVKNNFKKES